MSHAHTGNCRCPKPKPVYAVPEPIAIVQDPPPGCYCGQPWGSVLPPPPCPHHTMTLAWYGGVHALERALLRKLLGTSFLASTDTGTRLFFSADWMDLTPAEAAMLQSMED